MRCRVNERMEYIHYRNTVQKAEEKKTPARKCKNNTKTTDKMTIYTFLVHPLTLLCRDTSSSDTIWSARCTIHIQRHQQSTGEKKILKRISSNLDKTTDRTWIPFLQWFFPGVFWLCFVLCVCQFFLAFYSCSFGE